MEGYILQWMDKALMKMKMNAFKGSDRIFRMSTLFCQLLGHLKDKRFSWGASAEMSGTAFTAVFTVDL